MNGNQVNNSLVDLIFDLRVCDYKAASLQRDSEVGTKLVKPTILNPCLSSRQWFTRRANFLIYFSLKFAYFSLLKKKKKKGIFFFINKLAMPFLGRSRPFNRSKGGDISSALETQRITTFLSFSLSLSQPSSPGLDPTGGKRRRFLVKQQSVVRDARMVDRLFEDIFQILRLNPDGKKFDKGICKCKNSYTKFFKMVFFLLFR